ncbi:unnamed protein product [Closterium sp. NIES-53]
MAMQKERSSSNGSPGTTPTPPPASGLQTEEGTAIRPRATSLETPTNQAAAFDPDMMEKFFSFMSFYEQHQQGAPAQSNNSNNNNATPKSLDGSSYARGNQQQPTFAPYEPQRGSVSFMPHPQPASGQEKTLDALQVQSQFTNILGFFDGSLPYPTHGTQYDKQQYTYQSMMAYTILLRNITPNQQQNIRSYRGYGNSAELAYNHLKNLYQATDSVNQSRLMAQLTTVEMKPGEKGMAYISRCREWRDKLLRCGGLISEDAFVTVIIGGLGPQWHSTRAILRAHGKISEAALCAEIHAEQQDMDLQEERHNKKASVPEFAFHTQRRYNNNNYRHQPKPVPPFCHLCKTSGHPRLGYNLLSVSQLMAKGIHLEANSTTQDFKLFNRKGGLYIGKAVLNSNVFVLDFVPDLGTADSNGIVTFTSWTHPPDLDHDFSPEGFWYSHTIPEAEQTRALATIQHSAAAETTSATSETTAAVAATSTPIAVAPRDVIFYERLTLSTYLANLEEDRDPTGGFRGDRAFASAADKADWDEQNVHEASEEARPLPYCSVDVPMDDENPRESANADIFYHFADNGYVTPAEVNTNEAERIGPNFIPDPETGDEAAYPADTILPRYT